MHVKGSYLLVVEGLLLELLLGPRPRALSGQLQLMLDSSLCQGVC